MKYGFGIMWCFFLMSGLLFAEHAADDVELAALVKKVVDIARSVPGVGEEGQKLSEELQKQNPKKVCLALLPLLKHPKAGVPNLASYMILDCAKGLMPSQLPVLKQGFQNGGGWLPHAIASLGTDEATEFLVKEFRKNPQTQGQVDWSLIRLGEKSVPYLLVEFEKANPEKESSYFSGVRHIFKEMKGKAETALPRLMEIAVSELINIELRKQAVLTIGHVGAPAEKLFPQLKLLAKKNPEMFAEVVKEAIMASDTTSTAEIMVEKVNAETDPYMIRDIALLGVKAKAQGSAVMKWLESPLWESRVMAARTLGAIGYQDGRQSLEKLLETQEDWRLAYVATKSLVDLKVKESIPALKKASKDHWFPIVRDSAVQAIGALNEGSELQENNKRNAGDLMDYVFVDRDQFSIDQARLIGVTGGKKQLWRSDNFSFFKKEYPEIAKEYVRLRDWNGSNKQGFGRVITKQLDGGLLIGVSAGEWVGGLHFSPRQGPQRMMLKENIFGIEKWKREVVVVSGMLHMGMNEGMAHRMIKIDGEWTLVPWFVLPGCPSQTWVTETNQLVIVCIGGTLVFTGLKNFKYQHSTVLGE